MQLFKEAADIKTADQPSAHADAHLSQRRGTADRDSGMVQELSRACR